MIMHFITAFSLLCFLIQRIKGLPYNSINDLYDTNYEYEFGENQAREEVFITQTPQFLSKPLAMVVNEGHTVRLPCLVDRLDGFVLLWRKNNQIISVGSQIFDKSNSKIRLDEAENGNTLVIHQADNTDEAEYVCSVSAYRKTELKHNIRIRVQPVITTSPQESLIVNEGDPVTLSCQLQLGTPMPKLKWRKCEAGSFLSVEDEVLENVLKFESVTRDDSGCYVCEADNGFAEEPVTSKVMLVVEYSPSVEIQKTEDSSNVTTITCVVESEPEAEVTLLKDGETIDDASQRIVVNKKTLQLVDSDKEHYGTYSCKAKNYLGSAENRVKISGGKSDAIIGESKVIYDHFKNSQHEPSKEKGYRTNIHESETLIQDNKNGIDITRAKKSSGKIYFARVPALYTLPEKESKPIPIKRSHFLESRPRNVNEFLKLLRIYHQSRTLRDETDSIDNEDNHTVEHTTDNKLLRSTHSYVGHLNTQLESESVIERGQVNASSEPKMNIQDRVDSEERKPTRTNDEKKIKYEEAKPKEEVNKIKKGKEITNLALTNSESSSINGRYLGENEILTENASLKDPIETDILYTSNTSAMLRGHHAKQINMEHVKAEDIFVQLNKTNEDNENIDNPLDDINGKRMSYNDINKDEPKVKEESQQKETAMGKKLDWFRTGKVGTRYRDDAQITDMSDDKTVDENRKNIHVFRGQHLSQTTLQNIKSDEQYTLAGFDDKKNLQEPRMKTEIFGDNIKERQILQVTEPERKNNYAHQILTNSRYIKENIIKEEREETQKDIIETKSKAFRGHHSIQSNLADTGEGDIENSSSNSGVNKSFGSSLEIDDHAEPKGQTLNNEQVEKEGTSAAKETMYPKEIMNIEKLFFTKLSNIELPKSETIHPLVPPKENVHSQELEIISKLDQDGENDAIQHPLQIPTTQVYTETKVQFRGNHAYEKGLKNVNSETVIGKNNYKKSSEWSKPLRGGHSYNKRIGEDNGNKQNKRSQGPHPFRSLRLRVP